MKRNEDCIRSIMMYLEENLSQNKSIKVMDLYCCLPEYSKEDVNESALIILERKLAEKKNMDSCSARTIKFSRITDKGHNYLDAIRDETVWKTLKDKFSGFLTPENIISMFQMILKSNGIL